MPPESQIRERVLRALALNRTPGYHFVGHFLDISFDLVTEPEVQLAMDVGPHVSELNGNVNYGALAAFADMATGANVRAGYPPETRLATVQMNLQFSGVPMTGELKATSELQGHVEKITSVQAAALATIAAHGKAVCFASSTFMVLDAPQGVALHAMEQRKRSDPPVAPLAEADLDRDERKVLAITDAALAESRNDSVFIRNFWGISTLPNGAGATAKLANGPHVSNRVGHLQGGVTMALGIASAEAALPPGWTLSAVTAWFIRPGIGRVLNARSGIVHDGRLTAVVRTEIFGKDKRRMMEMITTHARKSG